MATRLRVAVVGQFSAPKLIKIHLDGDAADVRSALINAAAAALNVVVPISKAPSLTGRSGGYVEMAGAI